MTLGSQDHDEGDRLQPRDLAVSFHSSNLLPPTILVSKPWLDVSAPLALRAKSLLSAPIPLHPADAQSNEVFHLIKQCCKQSQREGTTFSPLQALTWAEDILERLVLEKKKQHHDKKQQSASITDTRPHDIAINIKLWDLVVFGWARQISQASASSSSKPRLATTQRIAPSRMQQVMERALEEAIWDQENLMTEPNEKNNNEFRTTVGGRGSLPTVDLFNTYLFGLAQSATFFRNAPSQAKVVLEQMQELHAVRGWHCRPNTKSFSHALAACAKAARAHAYHKSAKEDTPAFMALDLLRQMQTAHAVEKKAYEEQYQVSYDTHNSEHNRRRIITADAVAYTSAMQALANAILYVSSNQPRRTVFQRQQRQLIKQVMALLQEMMGCRDGTVAADSAAFVVALQAFARLAGSNQQPQSYRIQAAQQCEKVLQMRLDYIETIKQRCAADDLGHDGATDRLLKDLTDPAKILMGFNICLDAWSKSGAHQAVDECERILQSMLAPDSQAAMPDTNSLHACLRACSLSINPGAVDRAYELLKLQHELVSSGLLRGDARPDFQSYCLLILSVANRNEIQGLDKVQRARELLEDMAQGVQLGTVQPLRNPTAPFSAVLTAAAQSFGQKETAREPKVMDDAYLSGDSADLNMNDAIFDIAQKTYEDAKQDTFRLGVVPDHHLFAAMLRVLTAGFSINEDNAASSTSMSNVRSSYAREIMADAQEAGQVSRLVVLAWANAMSLGQEKALATLLPAGRTQLPKLWTRHVPPEFRFRMFPHQARTYTKNHQAGGGGGGR